MVVGLKANEDKTKVMETIAIYNLRPLKINNYTLKKNEF